MVSGGRAVEESAAAVWASSGWAVAALAASASSASDSEVATVSGGTAGRQRAGSKGARVVSSFTRRTPQSRSTRFRASWRWVTSGAVPETVATRPVTETEAQALLSAQAARLRSARSCSMTGWRQSHTPAANTTTAPAARAALPFGIMASSLPSAPGGGRLFRCPGIPSIQFSGLYHSPGGRTPDQKRETGEKSIMVRGTGRG